MIVAEAPEEYDPWGRPGAGVGPRSNLHSMLRQQPPQPSTNQQAAQQSSNQEPPPVTGQRSYRSQVLTSDEQKQLLIQHSSPRDAGKFSQQPNSVVEPSAVPGLGNGGPHYTSSTARDPRYSVGC